MFRFRKNKNRNSILSKRLKKFKSIKRGYYSFLILLSTYVFSFLFPLFINDKPLISYAINERWDEGESFEDSNRNGKYDKAEKYEPNLSVKLPFHYNKFVTDLYSDFSSAVNIFNIKKFQRMECDIFADKVWRMNDKFYMKWKCKIIHMF